jgi:uncharacterized membrane protein
MSETIRRPGSPGTAAVHDAATAAPDAGGHRIDVADVAPPVSARLESLDVFRGATIAAMLLVNNPGTGAAVYAPLRHAEWHGWTPTDLIFPFFLFIVGVAMVFSFGKMLERGGVGRGCSRRPGSGPRSFSCWV